MSHRSCLIFLFFLALAANPHTLSAQKPRIQVQVADYTDLKPQALREVVALIQDILDSAGVSAKVKLCGGSHVASCESETGEIRRLLIRVLPWEPKKPGNPGRRPLGVSFAGHGGGTYATVFLEGVQDEAAAASVPRLIVLAYTVAHEVGHLLLGDEAHTARGLMKPHWNRKDYEAMSQGHCHFSAEQMQQLTTRFGPSAPEPVAIADAFTSPH